LPVVSKVWFQSAEPVFVVKSASLKYTMIIYSDVISGRVVPSMLIVDT
jgi:hypothetical protein